METCARCEIRKFLLVFLGTGVDVAAFLKLSGVRITVTQSTSVSAAEGVRPSSRDLESQMHSQRSSSLERL
jgi:hypothetical protein